MMMTSPSTPLSSSPRTAATPRKQVRQQLSQQMKHALDLFNSASVQIEQYYQEVSGEMGRLSDELEKTNLDLRRNLLERQKMQAILVSALQSLTVGVLAVGQDGTVILANPAACSLFGRPLEQLATRRIDQVLEGIDGMEELLLTLQGSRKEAAKQLWIKPREGQGDQCIELAAVRSVAPYDLHLAGVILAEDKTQLRSLEQQAALRNRLMGMGEIAMNLAHEIRNPLGSIQLFASTLAHELQDNPSLAELAQQIVTGVKSLEHLVSNTLEFARPRRMSMTQVDLGQVIEESLVYVDHPLKEKSIRVKFEHPARRRAQIVGDAEQLKQVFLNLMLNAIQAMDELGQMHIELSTTPQGGWRVRLSDNGAGITSEAIEHIFDPFFTTKDKGSGIGLAVVHTIVSAHGAQIQVYSQPGQGTAFEIVFPKEQTF